MNKMVIGLIVIVMVVLVIVVALAIPRRRVPPQPSPSPQSAEFLFNDTYDDSPTITKTTHDIWTQIIADTKKGNYWSDTTHFLEDAESAEKSYTINPDVGNAVIADLAHDGAHSVEITVSAVPSGYTYVSSLLARYIRNQSLITDGTYEIGAWFYVPGNYTPVIVFGMENHPTWLNQYFAYAGIDTVNGSIFAMNDNKWISVGTVDFKYDTWFKLWIVWDTRTENFTVSYGTSTEEKTFDVSWVWKSGPNLAYMGYSAFNFYAGAGNVEQRSQTFYVGDFYAEKIE